MGLVRLGLGCPILVHATFEITLLSFGTAGAETLRGLRVSATDSSPGTRSDNAIPPTRER
jgi:hypothetical protein